MNVTFRDRPEREREIGFWVIQERTHSFPRPELQKALSDSKSCESEFLSLNFGFKIWVRIHCPKRDVSFMKRLEKWKCCKIPPIRIGCTRWEKMANQKAGSILEAARRSYNQRSCLRILKNFKLNFSTCKKVSRKIFFLSQIARLTHGLFRLDIWSGPLTRS